MLIKAYFVKKFQIFKLFWRLKTSIKSVSPLDVQEDCAILSPIQLNILACKMLYSCKRRFLQICKSFEDIFLAKEDQISSQNVTIGQTLSSVAECM